MVIETLQFTVIIFLLVNASILDLRYREIPNWISVTIVLTALLNFDVRNLWGLIAAALIFIIALVTGKIGGGDVKLIMALSIVCGLWSSLALLFFAQITMLFFYAITVIVKKFQGKTAEKGLPFAPFITFGYLVTIFI